MQFKLWLESFGKYKFIGQCDRLRRNNPVGEQHWQDMMAQARPVTMREFLTHVDMTPLLDDDEDPETYFQSSPDAEFYASRWGDAPAYYFGTSGFEFIFVAPK